MTNTKLFSLAIIATFCFVDPALGIKRSPRSLPKPQTPVSVPSFAPSPRSSSSEKLSTLQEPSAPAGITSPPAEQSQAEQLKQAPFRFQVGAGLTLIPARGIQYVSPGYIGAYLANHYYQGGFQGNMMLRAHPRFSVGFGLGYLATSEYDSNGNLLQEMNLTAILRIYLRPLPNTIPSPLFIMPYLSIGPQFSMLFPQINIRVLSQAPPSEQVSSYHLFSLGAYLGVGAEFRLKPLPHLVLHAEGQFLMEGLINKGDDLGWNYANARLGGQLNLGAIWYF